MLKFWQHISSMTGMNKWVLTYIIHQYLHDHSLNKANANLGTCEMYKKHIMYLLLQELQLLYTYYYYSNFANALNKIDICTNLTLCSLSNLYTHISLDITRDEGHRACFQKRKFNSYIYKSFTSIFGSPSGQPETGISIFGTIQTSYLLWN